MIAISFAIYIFLLIFCPLAFGTVELWSISCMEFLAPMSLLAYVLSRDSKSHWYKVPGFWPFVLLLVYMGVQLVPLPFDLVCQLSPKAAFLYEPAQAVAGGKMSVPLSLHSKATLQQFLRFASYLAFYVVTVQLLSDYRRLRKVLLIVVGLAALIAFLAILQKFSSPSKIYWFRDVPRNALPFGPWVSRNHFAGFMEMIIPIGIVLAMHNRPHITYEMPLRERFIFLFTLPKANLHILLNFSVVLMVAALAVSISRGGILSSITSILFLGGLLAVLKKGTSSWQAMTVLALSALLMVTWLGWDPILSRFDRIMNQEGRLSDGRFWIWQDSLQIMRDFWRTGAGFGSFQAIFPVYKEVFVHRSIVDHAHNDFIELISEGGIVAVFLVGWFLSAVIREGWQKVRQRHDPFAAQMYCGAVAGMVAIFFHSLTDFNMHNPANGFYFFFLCGITVSSANSRRLWERRPTYLTPASIISRYLIILPVLVLMIGGGMFNVGQFVGEYHYKSIRDIYLNSRIPATRMAAIKGSAEQAIVADPLKAGYHFAKANIAEFEKNNVEAQAGYARVLLLKPTSVFFTSYIGRYFETINPVVSKICFDRLPLLERRAAEPIKFLAKRMFKSGDIQGGFDLLRQAFALETNAKLEEYVALLRRNNLGLDQMESILPERVGPFLKYADYYARNGQIEKAGFFYRKALTFLDHETRMKTSLFLSPYAFFLREKRYGDALAVIREGIQRMPGEPILHLRAGDAYMLENIPYRAKEEYEKVLTLDQDNKEAAKKLRAYSLRGM
ncbi:MAG: O-antigen ligase family protein [Desulfobulbaceae bacterium]|nr:O-antigen ligase family protein [Desulfobulbaceae bacterium]